MASKVLTCIEVTTYFESHCHVIRNTLIVNQCEFRTKKYNKESMRTSIVNHGVVSRKLNEVQQRKYHQGCSDLSLGGNLGPIS